MAKYALETIFWFSFRFFVLTLKFSFIFQVFLEKVHGNPGRNVEAKNLSAGHEGEIKIQILAQWEPRESTFLPSIEKNGRKSCSGDSNAKLSIFVWPSSQRAWVMLSFPFAQCIYDLWLAAVLIDCWQASAFTQNEHSREARPGRVLRRTHSLLLRNRFCASRCRFWRQCERFFQVSTPKSTLRVERIVTCLTQSWESEKASQESSVKESRALARRAKFQDLENGLRNRFSSTF